MAKLVTKFRYYKPGGRKKIGGYAKYIALRDGVERCDDSKKYAPVSYNQKQLIAKILRDYPDSAEMLEYDDYKQHPTVGNASEFISRAIEDNAHSAMRQKTYADYIATRPRVEKVGSHGLFSDEDGEIVLSEVAADLNTHEGNVWTMIVSLRREDAERLGYNNARAWQLLLRSHTQELADALRIPLEDLKWYGAFHNESHHPHIHVIAYTDDPKVGYLSKNGVEQMRSALGNHIFRDDLQHIFREQTVKRNELKKDWHTLLEKILADMAEKPNTHPEIEANLAELSLRLSRTKGKKVYGYACASGMSFLSTDTKGDIMRNYGSIASKYYGYNISVIDLRNPMRSHGNNLLHLVNKYMDLYSGTNEVQYKAKAEKYAKIIAKTIILSGMEAGSFGQNSYFYDAAEGLITASILLVSEFCKPEERHIVSVFKIIQELLAPGRNRNKNQFQQLMELLPPDHKAKWFAGAALNTAEQSMASVMSTALSRLNAFLDSELETILCNDTEIDAEQFCKEKSAIFIIMPEEDSSKYFMVSLLIQQLYREILAVADEHGGKLENRVVFYCDEFGTLPRIESAEMMFSASRSRRVSIVPIIQSFAQLEKNYGKEGAEIIIDNTQLTVFGGFAPNSESAQILSKAMGSRTALTGSVTQSKGEGSRSLQMIERPLMTPDELKALPKGTFIVTKTGFYPIKVKLKLFFKWGIRFEKEPFTVPMRDRATICYASREELSEAICNKYHVADDKNNGKDIPDSSFRVEEAMAERHYSSKKAAARHKGLRTNLGQDGGTK